MGRLDRVELLLQRVHRALGLLLHLDQLLERCLGLVQLLAQRLEIGGRATGSGGKRTHD
jgi:hypothetical protein